MRRRLSGLADVELVRMAREQPYRRDAFAELARRKLGGLRRLCARICRDEALAEDCAQEAIVRAWLRIGELKEPEAFSGWLRQIAARLCLDALRSVRTRDRCEQAAIDEEAREACPVEDGVHARLDVERLLGRLDATERTILLLRADGMRWNEIADTVGLGVSAAKMRGHRAIQKARGEEADDTPDA